MPSIKQFESRQQLETIFSDLHQHEPSAYHDKKTPYAVEILGSTDLHVTNNKQTSISASLHVGDITDLGIKSLTFVCPHTKLSNISAQVTKKTCNAFEKLMSGKRVYPEEKSSR